MFKDSPADLKEAECVKILWQHSLQHSLAASVPSFGPAATQMRVASSKKAKGSSKKADASKAKSDTQHNADDKKTYDDDFVAPPARRVPLHSQASCMSYLT